MHFSDEDRQARIQQRQTWEAQREAVRLFERQQLEWLNQRIKEGCPAWPFTHRFEYLPNTVWRASYFKQCRKKIRDYELLKGQLDLDGAYELSIQDYWIYVEAPRAIAVRGDYASLRANVPMDSPLEPEKVFDLILRNRELNFFDGSFQNILKSHVIHFYAKRLIEAILRFHAEQFAPLGYSAQAFLKGQGRGVEYVMILTHCTETPGACIHSLSEQGYRPYKPKGEKKAVKGKADTSETQTMPEHDLAARERQLLQELEDVRRKMAG